MDSVDVAFYLMMEARAKHERRKTLWRIENSMEAPKVATRFRRVMSLRKVQRWYMEGRTTRWPDGYPPRRIPTSTPS